MRIPPELATTLAVAVEEGSLDAAARRLHVTQPAVSQRLQTLERLTGQVLLVRSRPVRPTAAGEAVIRFARGVEQLDAELVDRLGIADGASVVLPIAVNADSVATWILPALARAAQSHHVVFDLLRDDEGRTADLLTQGQVVAAVTTRRDAVPGCSVTALGDITYSAMATPEFVNRWFSDGVSSDALASAPVVNMDAHDTLQARYLQLTGVDPEAPPRHRIPSSEGLVQAIALGFGWGMVPRAQVPDGGQLVGLGGPTVTVRLYWQQWRTHSNLLGEVAASIASEARAALD